MKVLKCGHCGERFGTQAAMDLHRTGSDSKPRCRDKYEMNRRGAWQGFGNIWWTPDRGFDDDGGVTC